MPTRRSVLLGALAAPALAACAAGTSAASPAPQHGGGRVLNGADRLAAQRWKPFAGHKVGVLTNPTGILANLTHLVDDMAAANVKPVAVFGPEHGFRGTAQAGGSEGNYTDPRTGIPVYDAYGATVDKLVGYYRKAEIDTMVFDIQGVGARFYTYTWAMYTAMKAAVQADVAFVVLDRPNPIGGQAYGPMLDPKFSSGVGLKPIVQQPGMTAGELAKFFDAEFLPSDGGRLKSLQVVTVQGWRRGALFTTTGLPWVLPSPNMPTTDTAVLYPGTCMFEGTVLAEGRGTCKPFELIGAPGIDWKWALALNAMHLPGVEFRENYFVPTFEKFVNETCGGVQVHITDATRVDPIRTAVAMIVTAKQLYPTVFGWRPDNYIDLLTGSDRLRTMVDGGASVDAVVGAWQTELADFRRRREPYLLYH